MIWVYLKGFHAPHGPLRTVAEARDYAEQQAQLYPGQAVWLLVPSANVMVASAEAIWDEGLPLNRVRPLHPGYAELLATTPPAYAPPKKRKPEVGVKRVSKAAWNLLAWIFHRGPK